MKFDNPKLEEGRKWAVKNRKDILLFLVALVMIYVRIVGFSTHPAGFNQDEASIGYDTYALMHYGIDRNGCTLPVHFLAWGSGQNALYAYFSMPFVALFGLSVFSVRLVNLIFSILSVLAIRAMVEKAYGYRAGMIAMALAAISPWNIMLSRWSLESNLFPSMFILCLWAITKSFEKNRFLWLAAFLLAITMYSYGAAYLVITLFCVFTAGLYAYAYKKNKPIADGKTVREQLPLKGMIVPVIIFIVCSVPIYLFMYVNVFNHDTIHIGLLTIPHTLGSRISTSSGTTLKGAIENIIKLCLMQTDGAERNAFNFYGCIYVISLPFTLLGCVSVLKNRKPLGLLIFISFICSMLLFAYYADPNVNRVNAVYFPMLLLAALGINELAFDRKAMAAIITAYAICFGGFVNRYFSEDYKNRVGNEFFQSFGEAIVQAEEVTPKETTIYCTARVNMPYIFTLFYSKEDPHVFVDTVEYSNPGAQFQYVNSYGRYIFSHDKLQSGEKGTYIIENGDLETMRGYTDEIYEFKNYSVAVIR